MSLRVALLVSVLSLAASAASAQVPATSNRPAAELYKQMCQACHMADGNAALKPMNFADGEWKHGTTTKEMVKVISNGVPGTAMMPFSARLSPKEIEALALYVRAFDKKLKAAPAAGARKKKTT